MKRKFTLSLLLFCSLINLKTQAQNLVPDSLYADQSVLHYTLTFGSLTPTKLLRLSGQRILMGGYDVDPTVATGHDYLIDMLVTDFCGNHDPSFGVNGEVRHAFDYRNLAYDFALQSDGKILTCGMQASSNAGSGQLPFVARFNADGSPDTTFGTMGSVMQRFDPTASGKLNSVHELPDGRIICGGYSASNINGGTPGIGAMRFFQNGTLDGTFNGDGIARYDINVTNGTFSQSYLNTSDLSLVVTGVRYDGSFNARFIAVCFDSTGALMSTYGNAGVYTDAFYDISTNVFSIQLSNNSIILGASLISASNIVALIKLDANGQVDSTFGTNGSTLINDPMLMNFNGLKSVGGKLQLLAGASTLAGTGLIIQLNANGSIDSSFATNGLQLIDFRASVSGNQKLINYTTLPGGETLYFGQGYGFDATRLTNASNVPHISLLNSTSFTTTGSGTYQWYLNGVLIPGATSNVYGFTQNGSYTVELTGAYGCTYMSDPFVLTNVGVGEVMLNASNIYYDSENQILVVKNLPQEKALIKLYTADGKIILDKVINEKNGEYSLSTSCFPVGMYFAEVSSSHNRNMHRFAIIR
jgi:uncharacterized delta-60 repeat protein